MSLKCSSLNLWFISSSIISTVHQHFSTGRKILNELIFLFLSFYRSLVVGAISAGEIYSLASIYWEFYKSLQNGNIHEQWYIYTCKIKWFLIYSNQFVSSISITCTIKVEPILHPCPMNYFFSQIIITISIPSHQWPVNFAS